MTPKGDFTRTRIHNAWIAEPRTQFVMHTLLAAGKQAFFVGGCVRNTILNAPVGDIDIATNAPPDSIAALFETLKNTTNTAIKIVPTGYAHGTITVVIDGYPYEITTFRTDIETDGRHAMVRFGDSMVEDAQRRDFTMNALYADADGWVYDPIKTGVRDTEQGYVRFIGMPHTRINEDHLRILRYFRFLAWYSKHSVSLDDPNAAACSALAARLDCLPRERVWNEMRRLLAAPAPAHTLDLMQQSRVLARIDAQATAMYVGALHRLEQQQSVPIRALRRLAVLGIASPPIRLCLSKREAHEHHILTEQGGVHSTPLPVPLMPCAELGYRYGYDLAVDVVLLRAARMGTALSPHCIADIEKGTQAVFPVKAHDLMPRLQGAELGHTLHHLKQRWIDSEFQLTRQELLK